MPEATLETMRVISLGWGVQSFALAAMSALGVLPPVAAAIHADTTHEREATYRFAAKWTPWLEGHGVKVVTVRAGAVVPLVDQWAGLMIPAFTQGPKSAGQVKRQCTSDWKIAPIRRWLQAHRQSKTVELMIGITLDEITRVKPSGVKYIVHRWPLVELGMRREDVARWLTEQSLEQPQRSACYFCPYQSARDWRSLSRTEDFNRAVTVDRAIRNHRGNPLFLHRSMQPLDQVDFRSEQERGQLDLFDNDCNGVCGI